MRWNPFRYAVIALLASAAGGHLLAQESIERSLYLTHAASTEDRQSLAVAVRMIVNPGLITVDEEKKSVTLRGTPQQIAMAEWLVQELDRPQDRTTSAAEYPGSASGDNVVKVFRLAHAESPQALQEIATTLRSVGDISRVFVCTAPSAIAVRGAADRTALAAWLVGELDRPAGPSASDIPEYHLSGDNESVVQVRHLHSAQSPQQLQEIATLIRGVADVRRLFLYHQAKAITLRGTPEQIALTHWLIGELDQPAAGRVAVPHEYRVSANSDDDLVRLLYLTRLETPEHLQQILAEIRSTTGIRRVFASYAPKAIALRGTATQIALAEKLIAKDQRSEPR